MEISALSKSFGSLAHLAAHLGTVIVAEREMERKALERCAKLVEKHAKAKIGEYQPESGPFAAWAELADATKSDRTRQGYSEDDPLLRTGALRDSIGHTVKDSEAQVGSNSDIAVYQELGTTSVPPRSFLGGALADKLADVRKIIGEEAVGALFGEQVFNRRLEIE